MLALTADNNDKILVHRMIAYGTLHDSKL